MLTAEIKKIIEPAASGNSLIITVGNSLRADDGVGPYIADRLLNPRQHTIVLNAGERPEGVIDKAIESNPAKTIIIDAADFGGEPGEVRIISEEEVPHATLTTHMFPLAIVSKILAQDTGAPVYFLGIQAKSMELGEGLSPEVKTAADEMIEWMSR